MDKFYVTTPIYYVNSKPHMGTLYTTVLADITARWNKLQGRKVFFLTGTDEHGQKIAERAKELDMSPKELADSMIGPFKDTWKKFEIEYDRFIRTTDSDHIEYVHAWIKKLQDNGDIYKAYYTGWYCVPCETFVTGLSKDQDEHVCPSCKRPLREVCEESYFFRLSAYQDQLLEFYEKHPNFITPKERMNEVVSFVKSGLKDLSISRKSVTWGIPFPGDEEHTVYVWGEALHNYVSAVAKELDKWWPADLHIMGKDIVRFHAVCWPAFLMAVGMSVPKKLLVHGFLLMDEQKMSKSLGNVIDPQNLLEWYGAEPVRYYLARKMSVSQDGNVSLQDFEHCISADLSNNLGNLLNRTITLALNNGLESVESPGTWEAASVSLREKCEEAFRNYWDGMNHYQYHVALSDLWKFISEVNAFFHTQKPWELAKTNNELFAEVISAVCHALYTIGVLLWPIMPKKMEKMLKLLGHSIDEKVNYDEELRKNLWNKTFVLKRGESPLFPRIESKIEKKSDDDKESKITIKDFAKVELLVGTILECEAVEGSSKLYKLRVDLGKRGKRTIFSGVAQYFKPEDLISKQGVIVSNLAPRKMMGDVSEGMMLFAQDDQGNFELVTVSGQVENGTRLS